MYQDDRIRWNSKEWEGRGYSHITALSSYSPAETEENHEHFPEDNRRFGRNQNWEPPE
jgi:hypothetical protein